MTILDPSQVEHWVRTKFPFPHYQAIVSEQEQPEKGRIYVTTEVQGPNGERIADGKRSAVYVSMRDYDGGMQQIEADFVV